MHLFHHRSEEDDDAVACFLLEYDDVPYFFISHDFPHEEKDFFLFFSHELHKKGNPTPPVYIRKSLNDFCT